MTRPLTFKAPRRDYASRVSDEGTTLFTSIEWTADAVRRARSAGAWFSDSSDHDFFNREAAAAAHEDMPS